MNNGLLNILISILLIAIIVERCTDFIFSVDFLDKFDKKTSQIPLKKLLAMIIGIILAFTSKIDIVSIILNKEDLTYIGYILTGILFAGGANLVSDVFKTFISYKKIFNDNINNNTTKEK